MFFHIDCADRTAQIALRHEAPRVWACGVRNLCQERGDGPSGRVYPVAGSKELPQAKPQHGNPQHGELNEPLYLPSGK